MTPRTHRQLPAGPIIKWGARPTKSANLPLRLTLHFAPTVANLAMAQRPHPNSRDMNAQLSSTAANTVAVCTTLTICAVARANRNIPHPTNGPSHIQRLQPTLPSMKMPSSIRNSREQCLIHSVYWAPPYLLNPVSNQSPLITIFKTSWTTHGSKKHQNRNLLLALMPPSHQLIMLHWDSPPPYHLGQLPSR